MTTENLPPAAPEAPLERPAPPVPESPAAKRKGLRLQVEKRDYLNGEPSLKRLRRELSAGVPGVLFSFLLHVIFFGLLALIVYNVDVGQGDIPGLVMGFITPAEEAAIKEAQKRAPVVLDSLPNTPRVAEQVETPPKTEAPSTAAEGPKQTGKVGVKNALGGRRSQEGRSALIKLFGGSKKSEGAVQMGLDWLKRVQKTDGRWELHQGYDDPSQGTYRTDTGATALALLCFLGAGNTHQEGPYKETVAKGLKWLTRVQKPTGNLHDLDEYGRWSTYYAHAQGTIVLCEAYALTKDPSLREPAQRALQFIYDSQNQAGGWKYQPAAIKGDLSVTGWQIMALQSARMAELDVPEEVLDRAALFLDSVSVQDGARYKYEPTDPDSRMTLPMTAEGLLCRQYLGWPKDHPALQDGVRFLLQTENLPQWAPGKRNVYYWYYATQVMHHMEGNEWKQWNGALRDAISDHQVKAGRMRGSWNPKSPEGDPKEHAAAGGRLYITCLCILSLEAYYRHLPIYRGDAPVESLESEAGAATSE
ncbi:MAG TPA: prenyltransferase/squalene oxidase repeat-containing protein [Planctomycetaceae bacterium]|nr:prenyltransferase/squalene oxidase repeat-containing protein [Planctomycetaceae bacterium]